MAPQPIAMSLDIDHSAVVQKTIKDVSGDNGIPKQFLPIGKAFV
jgi:hypothetical protein